MTSVRMLLRDASSRALSYAKGSIHYAYDFGRFIRVYTCESSLCAMDKEKASAHLLRTMHALEKGLALPNPTPGFGQPKARALSRDIAIYKHRFGEDAIYLSAAAVLKAYLAFQKAREVEIPDIDASEIDELSVQGMAGVKEVSRQEVWAKSRMDFRSFAYSRSSVRMFTGERVPEADLLEAIEIAKKSPSVCNRACARAYYTNDPELIRRALKHQNGNRGFGDLAGGLFIVAADNRVFNKLGERNQGWMDGGLFAMSLNYALHAMGYGVCMLNWSVGAGRDFRFRREFGIPNEHLVLMMIAVGHLCENYSVAISPRRDTSDFAIPLGKRKG